jgi:hypothetical protein
VADVPLNFTGRRYGANLTTKPGQPSLGDLWSNWDWAGWIRPQIDYAMSIGAFVIRLIGDVTVVNSGAITQATYNARWRQFAAYCNANGIMFTYTGCSLYGTDGTDNGTAALSASTIAGIINSSILAITGNGYDFSTSISHCDLVQEANAGVSGMDATKVLAIYAAVKPNVPAKIPCTFSSFQYTNTSWTASIITGCDCFDFHNYPQTFGIGSEPVPSDYLNGPMTTYPTKEVWFGEGGADRSQYTAQQTQDWYTGVMTLGNTNDSRVRGCAPWAVQDQDGHYGAFDASWAPRSEILLPWVRGLGGAGGTPAAPANLRVVNGKIIWDPTGCSNAWDSTKLYRDGVLLANPLHCLYDDSGSWGRQHKYEASAIAGASESVKSQPLYWPQPSKPALGVFTPGFLAMRHG